MKKNGNVLTRMFLLVSTSLMTMVSIAQEKKADIDVDINVDKHNWYERPWVWVVGGAVFILLLVALLRGGGRERREA